MPPKIPAEAMEPRVPCAIESSALSACSSVALQERQIAVASLNSALINCEVYFSAAWLRPRMPGGSRLARQFSRCVSAYNTLINGSDGSSVMVDPGSKAIAAPGSAKVCIG